MSDFDLIERAKRPEDVFGVLAGDSAAQAAGLRTRYRLVARAVHPDLHGNAERAKNAFAKLSALNEEAERRLRAGIYGKAAASPPAATGPVTITRRDCVYVVGDLLAEGDLCNVYRATRVHGGRDTVVTLKVARSSRDNDLVENEAEVLRKMKPTGTFAARVPSLVDSFKVPDPGAGPRQVNALSFHDGCVTLAAVRDAYPAGVFLEDAVWMTNRLLEVLTFVHASGHVHGAVLPSHVVVSPKDHGGALIDWSYAVGPGKHVGAVSLPYKKFYPHEVLSKEPASPHVDLYMAARTIVHVLGGDSARVPEIRADRPGKQDAAEQFRAFLGTCLTPDRRARPRDAFVLRKSLGELMRRCYGPPAFHNFAMP